MKLFTYQAGPHSVKFIAVGGENVALLEDLVRRIALYQIPDSDNYIELDTFGIDELRITLHTMHDGD